jgi:hypothetical protein
MHALTMLDAWDSPANLAIFAAYGLFSVLAATAEALGMRAMPAGSHGRADLDERPLVNRAAVIVCALIAPWGPLANLARRH